MSSRIGSIIGWICVALMSALHLFAGIMKFVPQPAESEGAKFMAQLGLTPGIEHVLGIVEFAILILYVWPRTSTIGVILMIAYTAGILSDSITHGLGFADTIPVYVMLLLLAVSAYFRNPELLARLKGKTIQA